MKYVPVIGLEIHVQLATRSKMFCRCSADVFGKEPNSYTCPVCLGLPGALPVPNAEAIRLALLAGEALGSKHPKVSKFDRKNYFYPDLPKGYQISQYDQPLNLGGQVEVNGKKIKLTRAHLEEDTGKLLHEGGKTLVDFNRSGLPLLEIVSDPVISSPEEARAYGQKVQLLMRYVEASEADMEKGSLRVDANISLRPATSQKLGTKVEVKNMNSFRSVEKALQYEIVRQTKVLESGKKVVQETRGWDEGKGMTVTQRVKEGAEDYRYFPEPDLPSLSLRPPLIKELKLTAEKRSPDQLKRRLTKEYALPEKDAAVLTSDFELQDFYVQALTDTRKLFSENKLTPPTDLPKKVANWLVVEYLGHFRYRGVSWSETPVTPAYLAELVYLFDQGKISPTSAKSVLGEMFATGERPTKIVERQGLIVQSDIVKLRELAEGVCRKNPQAVSDFHHGKTQVFGFLLGQLMAETKGQAEPTVARQALEEVLKSAH